VGYFLVNRVLKNHAPFKRYLKKSDLIFKKVLCYNRDCVNMLLNYVIKMTFCVTIFYPIFIKRILSTQNRYSNQDKWVTAFQSEFHADFKSAHRFLFGCVFSEIYQFI
jgi:hypothetical protein